MAHGTAPLLALLALSTPTLGQDAAADLGPGDFEVRARQIDAADLGSAGFDLRLRLPEARRAAGRDLLAEMERLIALRFRVEDSRGRTLRCFGDLVSAASELEGAERDAWFADLHGRAPKLLADWGAGLSELLFDDQFRGDWDPRSGHGRDSMLEAAAWPLAAEGPPWNQLEGEVQAWQVATLIRADPATIKAAENDYRHYREDRGVRYDALRPVEAGYVRGVDATGQPFAGVSHDFRGKLPLWYGRYSCRLRSLTRIDAQGRLVCDFESTSDDFLWLAGRDVFLPLDTSSGERVAWLVVRRHGFDLAGVPEDALARLTVVRSNLGNLKQRAEARCPAGLPLNAGASFPDFRVLGSR